MENQETKPDPKEIKSKKMTASFMLFELGIEFAVMIALPLIAFIYIGRWLDAKTGHHFYVIIGILLALALSSYMIYRKINEVRKMLNKENSE